MGKSESKLGGISYDEAARKATEDEITRLRSAFKRASQAGYMNKSLFAREVLTDAVPAQLATQIFEAVAQSSRGISQRELISFLVILSTGTLEQRMRLLFAICSRDDETVTRPSLDSLIVACDGRSPPCVGELFAPNPHTKKSGSSSRHHQLQSEINDVVEFDRFTSWASKHHKSVSFMHWILGSEPGTQPSLSDNNTTPTFYQVMAGMTQLSDTEVAELERRYWQLKGASKTGKLDLETLAPNISPPLPECASAGLYAAIDTNGDGHVDFKEMCCAISTCCRSTSDQERYKFVFRIFDADRDGQLNEEEYQCMLKTFALLEHSNLKGTGTIPDEAIEADLVANIKDKLLKEGGAENSVETLSAEDFNKWALTSSSVQTFIKLLVELCHISLGLRPKTPAEEGIVVRGWIRRDQLLGFRVYAAWHLVSCHWFNLWLEHTGGPVPASSGTHSSSSLSPQSSSDGTASRGLSTEYTAVSVPRPRDADTPDSDGCLPQPPRPSLGRKSSKSYSGGSYPTNSMPRIDGEASPGLGPIENGVLCTTDNRKMTMVITNEGGQLRRGLHIDKDFTYVTEPVWKALSTWYNGGPALPRSVIDGPNGPGLELYLYNVKFYRHTTNNNIGRSSGTSHALSHLNTVWSWAVNVLGSSSGTAVMGAYYPSSASSSSANSNAGAVSQPPLPRRYQAYYASLSRKMSVTQLEEFVQQKLFMKPDDFRLWQMKEESPTTLLEDGDITLEDMHLDGKSLLLEVRNKDLTWPEEILSLAAAAKSKKEEKRKNSSAHHVERGTTGLSNLGNTCFLNSAVQCISNTQPLSIYFCMNKHLEELNRTNPMGSKGQVAKRYGDLVQDLWSGSSKSVAPLKFRWTLARHAPRFNSFQQQDAQELLAYLLDGLHEDLNRITDKPYQELQDSDGRVDAIVAKEAWDYHLKRNYSVIVELFHGLLKSSVRCLECGHTNNRFDPFTFLSLPLPMENTVYLEVIVVRQDGSVPTRYALRLSPGSNYSVLKTELSKVAEIPANQLLLAEIFGSTLRGTLVDSNKLRHALSGALYAFEVPIPTPIQPTDSCASVERIHITERLESLTFKRTSSLATECSAETSPTPVDIDHTLTGTDQHDPGSSSPQHERGSSSPQHERGSSSPQPQRWGDNCTHAEVTNNDPTEDDASSQRSALAGFDAAPVTILATADMGDADVVNGLAAEEFVQLNGDGSEAVGDEGDGTAPLAGTNSSAAHGAGVAVSSAAAAAADPRVTMSGVSSTAASPRHAVGSLVCPPCPEFDGFIFALHRKTYMCDMYFLAHGKSRPGLFGMPVAVACDSNTTHRELYQSLGRQLSRFVASPDPDAVLDDSDYPFVLKSVRKDGFICAKCPWWRFCTGCTIPCDDELFDNTLTSYIAIDWDSTALHLRYQNAQERALEEHESIKICQESLTESISLEECLEAFTKEEELGEDDHWYCSKCQKHQLAMKKLDIWKLPPILIVHVKRFQFVNSQWIKSQKAVKFPIIDFKPPSLSPLANCQSPDSTSLAGAEEEEVCSAANNSGSLGHSNMSSPPLQPDEENSSDGQHLVTAAVASDVASDVADDKDAMLKPANGKDRLASLASLGSMSEAVAVHSDPLSDEVALQGIVKNIAEEGLKDRLQSDEKIDPQTLNLAKLNELPTVDSADAGRAVAAGSDEGNAATSLQTCVSPSQSSTNSRKLRSQPTMAERLGKVHQSTNGASQTAAEYNLYAMTTHQGILGGGHYVSFACNPNGKWYCYNDSSCKEIERSRVLEESPYLLFYESSSIDYSRCLRNSRRNGNVEDVSAAMEDDELDREIRNNCCVM